MRPTRSTRRRLTPTRPGAGVRMDWVCSRATPVSSNAMATRAKAAQRPDLARLLLVASAPTVLRYRPRRRRSLARRSSASWRSMPLGAASAGKGSAAPCGKRNPSHWSKVRRPGSPTRRRIAEEHYCRGNRLRAQALAGPTRFLEDGRIELNTNSVECANRLVAVCCRAPGARRRTLLERPVLIHRILTIIAIFR
jgi:hypothetical protein